MQKIQADLRNRLNLVAFALSLAVVLLTAYNLQNFFAQRDLVLSQDSASPQISGDLKKISEQIGTGSNWTMVNLINNMPIPSMLLAETFPDKWDLYYRRGVMYEDIGEHSKAISDFTQVTKSPRNNTLNDDGHTSYEGYEARAAIYAKLGQNELAANDIKSLIDTEEKYQQWRNDGSPPNTSAYPPLYLLYAHYLTDAGKHRQALAALDGFFNATPSGERKYGIDESHMRGAQILRAALLKQVTLQSNERSSI